MKNFFIFSASVLITQQVLGIACIFFTGAQGDLAAWLTDMEIGIFIAAILGAYYTLFLDPSDDSESEQEFCS